MSQSPPETPLGSPFKELQDLRAQVQSLGDHARSATDRLRAKQEEAIAISTVARLLTEISILKRDIETIEYVARTQKRESNVQELKHQLLSKEAELADVRKERNLDDSFIKRVSDRLQPKHWWQFWRKASTF